MGSDLVLVLGALFAVLAVPSFASAYADRRFPTVGLGLALAAGGLVVWAQLIAPEPYSLRDVPEALIRVIARVLNPAGAGSPP
ncbi:hypothetical protein C2I36_02950 [Rhodobacteraceae bacterium WD3A24]|nr:hypothetical protein C2I36_02950 [Rhodobacteraceae bacterium WD3A24]